jgi:hypothetical protein
MEPRRCTSQTTSSCDRDKRSLGATGSESEGGGGGTGRPDNQSDSNWRCLDMSAKLSAKNVFNLARQTSFGTGEINVGRSIAMSSVEGG